MWRKSLLTTAAAAAMATGIAAGQGPHSHQQALSGDIVAFAGDLYAFGGDFYAFAGDFFAFEHEQSAYGGDILAFGGDLYAFGNDPATLQGDILAFGGDFNPFHGDLTPFYGLTSPFWGDIQPFWGDIHAFGQNQELFWGDIQPFQNGDPVAGGIGTFWADIGPMWGDIFAFWNSVEDNPHAEAIDWAEVETRFTGMLAHAEAHWGAALEASGTSWSQFEGRLLRQFGIELGGDSNLHAIGSGTRSAFFMALYDGLMAHAGVDQIDHWMPLINWTPMITQDQGEGHDAKVGLLDDRVRPLFNSIEYLVNAGGYLGASSAHGAAVASLIAAPHDGEGVMGIAPRATVYAYNPFDETGTTNIGDVALGIETLAGLGANVINMSLGVPGWTFHQDMADILTDAVMAPHQDDVLLVIAAGNEGATQATDITWGSDGLDTRNILIVGSVDPTAQISSFSNRPGDACFTTNGTCTEGNRLMDRFLVAPGELLLVSDNAGGTMRASGTSFAAPLVTGAISLLHDRWPWLQSEPEVTTQIILETARDLGEEGVDPIYGHGLLDVEAAQSPIDFDNLIIILNDGSHSSAMTSSALAAAAVDPATLNLWEAEGAYISAVETVGGVVRDFQIPLSSTLAGQNQQFGARFDAFQRHATQQMRHWANTKTGGFSQPQTLAATEEWALEFTRLGLEPNDGVMRFHSEESGMTAVAGMGNGLHTLTAVSGFSDPVSFDPNRGGANPLLGLAGGGGFGALAFDLAGGAILTFGYAGTALEQRAFNPLTGVDVEENQTFGRRDAFAAVAELAYRPAERLTVAAAFTGLSEAESILGLQGAGALAVGEDVRSGGVTVSARYELASWLALSGSATGSRVFGEQAEASGLAVDDAGLLASAFQVNAEISGVMAKTDRLTLSAAQPLYVESGALSFGSMQVTDRQTGDLGFTESRWEIGEGIRHFAFEADYSVALEETGVELGVFTRYDLNDVDIEGRFNALSVGGRLGFAF